MSFSFICSQAMCQITPLSIDIPFCRCRYYIWNASTSNTSLAGDKTTSVYQDWSTVDVWFIWGAEWQDGHKMSAVGIWMREVKSLRSVIIANLLAANRGATCKYSNEPTVFVLQLRPWRRAGVTNFLEFASPSAFLSNNKLKHSPMNTSLFLWITAIITTECTHLVKTLQQAPAKTVPH
jgi:hypothetical protein